jgi:uncharacterized integral membrane protein
MRKLSRWIATIAFILVVVISVLAVIDNRSGVALRFLGWSTPEISIYWWIIGAFGLGIAVGWMGASIQVLRVLSGNRRLRRDLDRSQTELARAKNDVSGA